MKKNMLQAALCLPMLLWGLSGTAQTTHRHSGCGTTYETQMVGKERLFENRRNMADLMQRRDLAILDNDSTIWVPIQFHLVGQSDGTGYIDLDNVWANMCRLNADYASQNIQFFLYSPPRYIANNLLYNNDKQGTTSTYLMALYRDPAAVNVYVGNDIVEEPGAIGTILGYYTAFPDVVYAIKGTVNGGSKTLTHELGHYFTLPHPFVGWENLDYTQERAANNNKTPGQVGGRQVEKVARTFEAGTTLYSQDFGTTTGSIPAGFAATDNDACTNSFGTDNWTTQQDTTAGDICAKAYASFASNCTASDWLIFQNSYAVSTTHRTLLDFNMAAFGNRNQELRVHISTAGNSIANFTAGQTITFATAAGLKVNKRQSIDLTSYLGQNVYLAFEFSATSMAATDSIWVAIDDVVVYHEDNHENCQTAADAFCDTDPDYDFGLFTGGCGYPGAFDPDGIPVPTASASDNFMSYFGDNCTVRFSAEQKVAIQADIISRGYDRLAKPTNDSVEIAPTLLFPTTNSEPFYYSNFVWSSVPNATMYQITIDRTLNGTFVSRQAQYITRDTVFGTGLTSGVEYTWKVRALNEKYNCTNPVSAPMRIHTVNWAVGVQNTQGNIESSRVFPNPATSEQGSITLEISATAPHEVAVFMTNSLGQQVLAKQNLALQQGSNAQTIDVSALTAGVYFVYIEGAHGRTTHKLVIEK